MTTLQIFFCLVLAVIVLLLLKIASIARPPATLRSLPTVPFFGIWYALLFENKNGHERSLEVTKRYGRTKNVFFIRWAVATTDPELVKQVYTDTKAFPKWDTLTSPGARKFFGHHNIVQDNGGDWKRQREICNPAFRWEYLSAFSEKFINSSEKAINLLEELQSKNPNVTALLSEEERKLEGKNWVTVEVTPLMQKMTLDILGRTMFDIDFEVLNAGDGGEWTQLYNTILRGLFRPAGLLIPFLWKLPTEYNRNVLGSIDKFRSRISEMLAARRKDLEEQKLESGRRDLLSMMLKARERQVEGSQHYMTDEEVVNNLCIFFLAGHDTTSTTLSMVMNMLAQHQDIQDKCREEALAVLDGAAAPKFESQKKLIYITQVIKETLRMFPPVGDLMARQAAEDIQYDDFIIPKGTPVIVNIYAMHHDPELWEDPFQFNPDRFGPEAKKRHAFAWNPFGMGPRACLGLNFSLQEQRTFLSMLLRQYRVLPGPTTGSKEQKRTGRSFDMGFSTFLSPKNLFLRFERILP